MMMHSVFIFSGLLCLTAGQEAQGPGPAATVPAPAPAPPKVLGIFAVGITHPPLEAANSTEQSQVPKGEQRSFLDILQRPSRETHPSLEAGHSLDDGHHHTHYEESKKDEIKSRKKRAYCSVCGGQLGYGAGGYGGSLGGSGGYGGGGYGSSYGSSGYGGSYGSSGYGSGLSGGCSGGCGGGGYAQPVYQQPIYRPRPVIQQRPVYQQPIYSQPSYGSTCNVCGRPLSGGYGKK